MLGPQHARLAPVSQGHRSPALPSWHVRWRSALFAPCGTTHSLALQRPSSLCRMFFCHAFRASKQTASCVARLLQIFLKALLVFAIGASLRGPTVGGLPGSGGHVFAGAVQFVLQTVLIFLGPFELVSRLCDCCILPLSCSDVTFFHGGLEGCVLLRQSV